MCLQRRGDAIAAVGDRLARCDMLGHQRLIVDLADGCLRQCRAAPADAATWQNRGGMAAWRGQLRIIGERYPRHEMITSVRTYPSRRRPPGPRLYLDVLTAQTLAIWTDP